MGLNKRCAWIFGAVLASASSWGQVAATQFRAVTKSAVVLNQGPGDKYSPTEQTMNEGEVLLVLGTSTGGLWLNVMRNNGTEGWIPKDKAELYRVPIFQMDEMDELFQKKRRVTSDWIVDLTVRMASAPNALGLAGTAWWIPFERGLTGKKIDQLEVGFGVAYGLRIFNSTGLDGKAYGEMAVLGQWMFRMPPRGSLMAGPKAGLAMVDDKATGKVAPHIVWGVAARYFPYDSFGFTMEILTAQRLDFFVTREVGVSFRF